MNPTYIGWLEPNEQFTLTFLINTTVPINCQATLNVNWDGQYVQATGARGVSYLQVSGSGSTSVSIPFTVYGEPNIVLTMNSTYLISNIANPVRIMIINNGSGPVYNLQVNLAVQGASITPGMSTVMVGTLNPGSNYTITAYLTPTISSGSVSLSVAYSGVDQADNSISGSYTESLVVIPASPSQVIVYPVNSTLSTGVTSVVLGIRNLNPVPIYNVTLIITSANGVTLIGNTTYDIAQVPPGGIRYLTIPVIVPVTSASASLTYALSYQYINGYPESISGSIVINTLNSPNVTITGYAISSAMVTGGSTISVSITLTNRGPTPAYNLEVNTSPGQGLIVIGQSRAYLSVLEPQQSSTEDFSFMVINPINTSVTFSVTYLDQFGQVHEFNYTVPIYEEPEINVFVNATYLLSNLANPVKLVVRNSGNGPVYNLQLSINVQGASVISSVNPITIGELKPGAEYIDTIYLTPTGNGATALTITYSGVDERGDMVSGSFTSLMSVVSASPSQVIVYLVNSSLSVGMGNLVIGVRNLNPVPIYNVTLVLTSVNGLSLIRNTTYSINQVMPGSTYYLVIPIATPITSSSASLTYILSYQYVNGYPESITGSLMASVVNLPSILITGYTLAPSVVTVGSTVSISINLVNAGPVSAYNLNISVIPGPGLVATSQQSIYLGTLSSQQLSAAAFNFIAIRPMNTTVTFKITYTDQFGITHIINYEVPVHIVVNSTLFSGFSSYHGTFTGTGYPFMGHYGGTSHLSYYGVSIMISLAVVAVVIIAVVIVVVRRHGGEPK